MKHNLAVVLVAVAIVAGGAVGWGVTRIGHHTKPSPSAGRTTPPQSVHVVSYVTKARPNGLALYHESDVSKLTGTTEAFQQFIASSIQKVHKDAGKGACGGAPTGIDVFTYATNGFAAGAADVCGGYQALWGLKNGVWTQLIASQGGWVCSDLHRLGAPKGILGDEQCADTASNKLINYAG